MYRTIFAYHESCPACNRSDQATVRIIGQLAFRVLPGCGEDPAKIVEAWSEAGYAFFCSCGYKDYAFELPEDEDEEEQ